jgi:hypothetical protein
MYLRAFISNPRLPVFFGGILHQPIHLAAARVVQILVRGERRCRATLPVAPVGGTRRGDNLLAQPPVQRSTLPRQGMARRYS